ILLSRPNRALGIFLEGILFLAGPAVVWRCGFGLEWLAILLLIVVVDVAAAVLFFRAARALGEGSRSRLLGQSPLVGVCPTVAARAHDRLLRDALAAFHPAALAAALMEGPARKEALAALLREIEHPTLPLPDGVPARALAAASAARSAERRIVESS